MNTLVLSTIITVWTFKALTISEALNITYTGSNEEDSTTYCLKCEITTYNSLASWRRDGSIMVLCPSTSACAISIDSRYSFRKDDGAIYVDFYNLGESEDDVKWVCSHGSDANTFTVVVSLRLGISQLGSKTVDSTSYCLKCSISRFTNQSAWIKDGSTMSTCSNSSCFTTHNQPYSYRYDDSAIYVDFVILEKSEDEAHWTCVHTDDISANFIVDIRFENELIIPAYIITMVVGIFFYGVLIYVYRKPLLDFVIFGRYFFFRGRLVYDIQILIGLAVIQCLAIILFPVFLSVFERKMGNSVELSYMLILLYPLLSVGILFFLGAFCGRKEWMHAKFEDHCNSLSLAHDCGMNFSTCNIDMISFKLKTSKEAHIRIYEQRPIVDIMLGYEDCKQAVVRQHNRVGQTDELKAKFHREILSSTEYRTFYLKSEKNNIALFIVLEGKEHSILKWTTDWDSKLLKLSDIVISNSIQDTIDIEKPIATPGEWMFLVHQGDHMHENEEPLQKRKKTRPMFHVMISVVACLALPLLLLLWWIWKRDRGSTEENDDEEKGSSENNDDEEKDSPGNGRDKILENDLTVRKFVEKEMDTTQNGKSKKKKKRKKRNQIEQHKLKDTDNTIRAVISNEAA